MTAASDEPQSVSRRRMARSIFLIAVVLVALLVLLGLLAVVWGPNHPQSAASGVSATFVGYTNNPVGTRVAIFNINNRSPVAVQRRWYYEVQVRTGSNWTPQPTVRLPYARGPVILPNESEIWTIKAPSAEGKWRVWFPYVEHQTRFQEMKEWIRQKLRGLGLPLKVTRVAYQGLSDEVEAAGAQ